MWRGLWGYGPGRSADDYVRGVSGRGDFDSTANRSGGSDDGAADSSGNETASTSGSATLASSGRGSGSATRASSGRGRDSGSGSGNSLLVEEATEPRSATGTPRSDLSSAAPDFDVVGIILRCRRTADLSQRELAALLGVSPSTVARWETGERMPSADTLAAIADLAGYRMGLIDHRGEPVTAAPRETLRDRRGRRIPPHLDVVLQEDTVWQADPEVPGGWRSVPHTIHTPRRWRRDLQRDDVAHTAVTRVPGCVPFHTNHDGSRRQCHDIPTPQDHADWSAIVATIHQSRRQQRQADRATWPTVPAPEPCFCDVDCHEGPGCSLGCPCHCEPAVSY